MYSSAEGFTFRNAEVLRLTGRFCPVIWIGRLSMRPGLRGLYNFTVTTPEDWRRNPPAKSEGPSPDSPTAGTFAELVKPLGLKLIAGMAPLEYLVVDHVERPSAN